MMLAISRFLIGLIFMSLFTGCEDDNGFDPNTEQMMDFEKFTLITPLDWTRFYPQGTDGFFGGLTNQKDTLYFDYGIFSFNSIDNVVENDDTINYHELRIGGYPAKIVLEKREGEIRERFSLYTDKRDGVNLNRIYCYGPKNQELVRTIFLSHRFK
jgi:hypothetical protein